MLPTENTIVSQSRNERVRVHPGTREHALLSETFHTVSAVPASWWVARRGDSWSARSSGAACRRERATLLSRAMPRCERPQPEQMEPEPRATDAAQPSLLARRAKDWTSWSLGLHKDR